jgi:hypothetical protein
MLLGKPHTKQTHTIIPQQGPLLPQTKGKSAFTVVEIGPHQKRPTCLQASISCLVQRNIRDPIPTSCRPLSQLRDTDFSGGICPVGFRDLRVVCHSEFRTVFTHHHHLHPSHTHHLITNGISILSLDNPGRIKHSTLPSVIWPSRNGSDYDCLQNDHIPKQLPTILSLSLRGRHAWFMASAVP